MTASKRSKRTGPLTMEELAEYLAIKMEDHLATMSPAQQKAHLAKFRRTIAALPSKPGRRSRTQASQASSRTR